MTVRQEQKQKTRAKLLRVALRIFSKKGIMATRAADIAKAAGLSHGSVFAHFPTRDDLVTAVIEEFGKRVTRKTHDVVNQNAIVREVLVSHLSILAQYEDFYTRLVMEGPLLPPTARSTLIGVQSAIALHLSAAMKREMAEGTIRQVSLPLIFNTWLGLVHHYLVNGDLFAPRESVLTRYGQDLLDHYMGLLVP